uniref:Uncharacterized protein n=1 Tax=Arundo donax TaxID=35708 RepID=A0A0A9F3F9_ARUDO
MSSMPRTWRSSSRSISACTSGSASASGWLPQARTAARRASRSAPPHSPAACRFAGRSAADEDEQEDASLPPPPPPLSARRGRLTQSAWPRREKCWSPPSSSSSLSPSASPTPMRSGLASSRSSNSRSGAATACARAWTWACEWRPSERSDDSGRERSMPPNSQTDRRQITNPS